MNARNSNDFRMTILGLIGSQRKLGNCELFVKEISRNIPYPHDLKLIRLPSLDIKPCSGCYRCINDGACHIRDDIPFFIQEFASADAIIVAAPVYFLGVHASVKRLLDRAFSFYGALQSIEGRPCVLVNLYGMRDRVGTSPQTLLTLAPFLGVTVKASLDLRAALPGDVIANKRYLRMAHKCAGLLIGEEQLKKPRRSCPFCGNRIVRMRRKDFFCTVCNGSFKIAENGRPIKGRPGWDTSNTEFIRKHREWLKGMKERYLAHKKEITARILPYKNIGRWTEPGKQDDNEPH